MEQEFPKNLNSIKLPPRVEIVLSLIKAELKSRKFIKGLEQLGFDASLQFFDFSTLILRLVGFEKRTDAIFDFYSKLLEDHSESVDFREDGDRLTEQALHFYEALTQEKQKHQ